MSTATLEQFRYDPFSDAAMRDPREFNDPDRFIWNRKVRRLFSFGVGPHFCIGIHHRPACMTGEENG